ncbi:MAG: histidine--tRNA ligase [Nitrospinaceae bacterium]|jgi:histidyl-tRNA synthetase|nr:histidine--tRNA ligase [Nitrospinaceae bacterium]
MKIQAIRGVKDILPDEIEKWQWVENKAHTVFARYGFKEIRPPIFEKTNLFSRGIGETTDIVEKEMYTFDDRSGEKVTLRPEGTASVVRAFIEHKMYAAQIVQKLYYLGPMFRYERPQAGRFRQFYQIGVEAMGSHHPDVDAEVMIMLMDFFKSLGLTGLKLQLNSLGCSKCRPAYRETLKDAIREHLSDLCDNCNQRYERNPLRVLDCKVPRDKEIAAELPKTADHLCDECNDHFQGVRLLLDSTNTPYDLDHLLVRGLDYYTHTTFEVSSSDLGAQNAICGGGRYNMLVEEFDGPPTPCFGFALGLERLISVVPFDQAGDFEKHPDVFIVCLGEEAQKLSFTLTHQLRSEGLSVERDYDGGSMKRQMKKANKSASRFALILGEDEINSGKYQLKNMSNSEQLEISADSCAEEIKKQL